MPPKVKITKEDITNVAVELIRENGESSMNARAIAAALGCSTQPIFSNFTTMEDLQALVLRAVHSRYLAFLEKEAREQKHPTYKAFGMAYIRFAREERELFKLLFMRDRKNEDLTPTPDYTESVDIIMRENGISRERAELFHLEMWACVHGIATMAATSFLTLKEELVSRMITDVYQGVRTKFMSEEEKG